MHRSTFGHIGGFEDRATRQRPLLYNVPASATVDMDEGEIVLTIELRDTLTDAVLKAERRTIPLIKAREIRP